MNDPALRRTWIETLGFIALGLFFYKVGFLFFAFLLPFQIIFMRRGFRYFCYAGAIFLGISALFTLGSIKTLENRELYGVLFLLETGVPFLFLLGLGLINGNFFQLKRNLYTIVISMGIIALIAVPIILFVTSKESLGDFFREQFEMVFQLFSGSAGQSDSFEASVMERMFNTDHFLELLKDIILRNFMFAYMLVVTGNWWFGRSIVQRTKQQPVFNTVYFRLPEYFIWPLLLSWAFVLLDSFKSLGSLEYVFWNTGLIFLFLFGLQGLGIIKFLFARYNVPRGIRLLLSFVCIILCFIPGVNYVIFIGIPGIGASELWIKYRKIERSD